jgi:hypothetical protein
MKNNLMSQSMNYLLKNGIGSLSRETILNSLKGVILDHLKKIRSEDPKMETKERRLFLL